MMQAKGSAIAPMQKFIEDKFGPDGMKKWLDALTPEARQVYSGKVMANSWYPLRAVLSEPMAKMCDLFYAGNVRGAVEVGRYSADAGLGGVYKIFVKAGSPDFIFKRASSLMTSYYNPSEIKVAESGSNKVVIHITKFEESSPMLEARIGGWMTRALEIHGCKNIANRVTKSLAKGDPCTEYVFTWA